MADLDNYATNDFVFFSLEAGAEPKKEKSRFGEHRYRAPMDALQARHEYTHMELTDLLLVDQRPGNKRPAWVMPWDEEVFFSSAEDNTVLSSVFVGANMVKGLALRIVSDLQKFSSDSVNNAYDLQISGQADQLMNSLFRPQIVVPHSITLSHSNLSYKGPANAVHP